MILRVVCLLAAMTLQAQHIRTKVDESADFRRIATFQFQPGLVQGRHSHLNEVELRNALEERLLKQIAGSGLRPAEKADVRIIYHLTAREEYENERRGQRTRRREITRYELQIRMIDPAGNAIWTATGYGTVEDWRHRYVQEHVVRAATLAWAKYPGRAAQ